MRLSEHFTLEEFTRSQVAERLGVDMTPPREVIAKVHDDITTETGTRP